MGNIPLSVAADDDGRQLYQIWSYESAEDTEPHIERRAYFYSAWEAVLDHTFLDMDYRGEGTPTPKDIIGRRPAITIQTGAGRKYQGCKVESANAAVDGDPRHAVIICSNGSRVEAKLELN